MNRVAVLVGAFTAHNRFPQLFLVNVHAQTLEQIGADPSVAQWLARGSRLSADEAVAYAEEQFETMLAPAT